MKLIVIAAVARNGVIGKDGGLPWAIKEDLAHFKRTTLGHTIIMGRRTWESLGSWPLPGRQNIVVSGSLEWAHGAQVVRSLQEALEVAGKTSFVIGGAQLYQEALKRATDLILTEIPRDYEGDTHFPDFDRSAFVQIGQDAHPGFCIRHYRRAQA